MNTVNPNFDPLLLSRVEDAGLNASAPPEQRWLDGWLVRLSPGKAKRARCINALAQGKTSVAEKLALCSPLYQEADLPLFVRITPFSQPVDLDAQLAAHGMLKIDDTRVMVCASLVGLMLPILPILPIGMSIHRADAASFAETVGAFRGSPPPQRIAQTKRLAASPVPYTAFVMKNSHGEAIACGQIATESEFVGLYDVYTDVASRSKGLAKILCEYMLTQARSHGATVGYLQVESDNDAARHIYRGLGFSDAYAYHYRQAQ